MSIPIPVHQILKEKSRLRPLQPDIAAALQVTTYSVLYLSFNWSQTIQPSANQRSVGWTCCPRSDGSGPGTVFGWRVNAKTRSQVLPLGFIDRGDVATS
eukprot:scaffold977_cov128-Cylindrotheca_fusiformis.AAC.9